MCVLCSTLCVNCENTLNNCSSCKTSPTSLRSFLFVNDSSTSCCLKVCPAGYWANTTSNACELCHPNCTTCTNYDKCYSCASGYSWYGYTCYLPCNSGFWNNTANCTLCNSLCAECSDATTCSICTLSGTNKAYLSGTFCYKVCPALSYSYDNNGTGPNICMPCDASCSICTNTPRPCSSCNTGYYLYNSTCGSTCPTGFVKYNLTNICLDCNTACVGLTIKMYFSDSLNSQIYVDMTFSQALNYSTFDYVNFQMLFISSPLYSMSMFNVTYKIVDNFTYRIIVQPTGYTFLYNDTLTVTTKNQTSIIETSQSGFPFKNNTYALSTSLNWFLMKGPEMSDLEKQIINGLSGISSVISKATTIPGLQELKKSGVFGILFSGAQITSTSVFVNSIPSQNLYEGARIWAIFVLYDVPEWEKNSDKPYLVVAENVYNLVKENRRLDANAGDGPETTERRSLFDMTTVYWRFHRTGQSSFFIFDVYIPLALMALSWILLLMTKLLKKYKCFKGMDAKVYTFMHKVHELSIFYVCTAAMLEWLNFDAASAERWISFMVCLAFLVYFVGYELYAYYDMIEYPLAEIGNQKYEYYVTRYSFYLKNIRFVEYDVPFCSI